MQLLVYELFIALQRDYVECSYEVNMRVWGITVTHTQVQLQDHEPTLYLCHMLVGAPSRRYPWMTKAL